MAQPVLVKQIGLVNLGNSCFYNTILQSLSVTAPLSSLIVAPPPTSPALLTLSPTSPTPSPDQVPDLPINKALIELLATLENTDSGKEYRNGFNPKALLRELSAKHEEYAEATQQDAHELLRHLIDACAMEESDLIKKLTPPPAPPPPTVKSAAQRRRMTLRAANSGAPARPELHVSRPSDENPIVGEPLQEVAEDEEDEKNEEYEPEEGDSTDGESEDSTDEEGESQKEKEKREREKAKGKPYIETVFGGALASVLVCEECQIVSLTREPFLDISLSLKDESGLRIRKRDRIRKTLQAGFFSKSSKSTSATSPVSSPSTSTSSLRHDPISLSETEGSSPEPDLSADEFPLTDDEVRLNSTALSARRQSLDPLHLRETRRPFWSGASKSRPTSREPSPMGRKLSVLSTGRTSSKTRLSKPKIPKPTPEHVAYVKRILVTIPGPNSTVLPLRWAQPVKSSASSATSSSSVVDKVAGLRLQAEVDQAPDQTKTDLYEALVNFTAVEVLEGENAFQCQNCWKLLNPDLVRRYKLEKEERRRVHRQRQRERKFVAPEPMSNEEAQLTPTALRSPVMFSESVPLPDIDAVATSPLPEAALPSDEIDLPTLKKSTRLSSGTDSSHRDSVEGPPTDNDNDKDDAGNLTDASINSGGLPSRRLTEANLALALPKSNTVSSQQSFEWTTTNSQSHGSATTSISRAASAASLSTRQSGSTRFSTSASMNQHRHPAGDTKTIPRSARHILRRAHKRYLISAPSPPILVIHLKRFQHTSKSLFGGNFHNLKKREDMVTFPLELDLKPFLAPEGGPPTSRSEREARTEKKVEMGTGAGIEEKLERGNSKYALYAVVVHAGSLKEGHFTTYVLSDRYEEKDERGKKKEREKPVEGEEDGGKEEEGPKRERRWFFCSDEQVRACTVDEVLQCKAYILFYERLPSPALSDPQHLIKSRI